MTPEEIHNHPTVQRLIASHNTHRIMLLALTIAVVIAAGVLVMHSVEMSHTLTMEQ